MTQSAILQIQVDESQPIRVDSPKVTLIIRNNSSDLYSNVNIEFEHRRDIRLYPAKIHLARLAPGPADIKKVLYLQTYAAGSYVIRGRANYFVEGRDRHAKAMEVELHIKVEPVMAPERQRIEPIKVPNLTDKVTLPGKTSISNSITDKPDRYADLKDSLHKGNVVAFVGAGFSIGAGLPGWYSLIGELAQRIGYELPPAQWATGEALIDAAQAYINEQGLHSLVMFLKDKLDTTGKPPTAAHQALARLPISLVLTANYDDLLERAYRDAGKRVHIVVRDSDIPFMRREPDAVNIVKLYGDLDQPDTIVLARQQYEAFSSWRPNWVALMCSTWAGATVTPTSTWSSASCSTALVTLCARATR